MNFTCISPKDNGFNFNVRFNEQIVIPENASIVMNFAQFERDPKIRFSEEQSIKIVADERLPYWDWYNQGNGRVNGSYIKNDVRDENDLVFKIPAGEYTINDGSEKSLQRKIYELLGTSGAKGFLSGANSTLYNLSPAPRNPSLAVPNFGLDIQPINVGGDALEISFGPTGVHLPQGTHPAHIEGFTPQTSSGEFIRSKATNAGAFDANGVSAAVAYDAYAITKKNYQHIGVNLNQYTRLEPDDGFVYVKDGGFDSLQNANIITFQTESDINDIEGKLFCGLYSQQAAGVNDIISGNEVSVYPDEANPATDYTNNTDIKNIEFTEGGGGFIPMCYFGIEIVGKTGKTDDPDKFCSNSGCINIFKSSSTTISDIPVSATLIHHLKFQGLPEDILTNNTKLTLGIQTYIDKNNKNYYHHNLDQDRTHIRVFIIRPSGAACIIYDTNTKHPDPLNADLVSFPATFFNRGNSDENPATMSQADAQAQTPFTPIISATNQNEGVMVHMEEIIETPLATFGQTNTLLRSYHLEMSEELARLFVPTTGTTALTSKQPLLCNSDDVIRYYNIEKASAGGFFGIELDKNEFMYRKNFIIPQFSTDQFAVIMNNLPIKSFKNTNDKSKSGYRKPILALVPQPFAGATPTHSGVIQGQYTPSYGITNRLSNQAITTNNFDILILDLETDRPAEQLLKSVINFTIMAD